MFARQLLRISPRLSTPTIAPLGARPFGSVSSVPTAAQPSDIAQQAKQDLTKYGSPDHHFEEYRRPKTVQSADVNRTHQYLVIGSSRFLYASSIRLAVLKTLGFMAPGRDVLALGSVEVDLNKIPQGTTATIKWRGKPVFVRRRLPTEVKQAEEVPMSDLRDPQTDSARVKVPEWLVVLGICTHLGCVPISNAGDYNGWFCPCHGSHYDTSGRIRAGPALKNLNIPKYSFIGSDKIILGA